MRDLASSLPNGIFGLVENRIGGSLGVRDNDRLLNVDSNGAREERQSSEQEAEESHGGMDVVGLQSRLSLL